MARISKIVSLAALAAAVWVSPAFAGWQFTTWDMSPGEVREASRGNAVRLTEEETRRHSALDGSEIAKLKMPFVQGDLIFNAYFLFSHDENKLTGVTLNLLSGDPAMANRMLRAYYGRPISDRMDTERVQVWFSGEDRIVAKELGQATSIQINPRMDVYNYGL